MILNVYWKYVFKPKVVKKDPKTIKKVKPEKKVAKTPAAAKALSAKKKVVKGIASRQLVLVYPR